MLLRFLSVTGALLSSCAALSLPSPPSPSASPDIDVVPQPPSSRILSHFRQIKVPSTDTPTTYLTLSFTTENDTLLANDSPIFPPELPLQFPALRHQQEPPVLLAYALDARPLPLTPGALLGDIFLLKLKLFDLHGRLASDHLVSISLATDPAGDLLISEVESVPFHARGSHHRPRPSWLAQLGESLEAVKSAAQNCWSDDLDGPAPAPDHASAKAPSKGSHGTVMDAHRTMPPAPHHRPAGYRPPYWMGKGSNGAKLLRPVVLPALLGVVAGIVACVTGFIVGRTVMAIYYCFRGCRQQRAAGAAVPAVEEGVSEKERLMEGEGEYMDDVAR